MKIGLTPSGQSGEHQLPIDIVRDTLYVINRGREQTAVLMIVSFRDMQTKAIYDNESTKAARKRLPMGLWRIAQRKLDQLARVPRLSQLTLPPVNRLEPLKGDREGQHSIRVNEQYRICFVWTDQGPADVEITDYH